MRHGYLLLVAAALPLGACSKPASPTAQLYARVPVPAVPDHTTAIANPLRDGQYWATTLEATSSQLIFIVVQATFDASCTVAPTADGCSNGFAIEESPTAKITAAPGQLTVVTVVAGNGQNYAIDGTELAGLVGGAAPSAKARIDFRYTAGPYLVTVSAGVVVAANEIAPVAG